MGMNLTVKREKLIEQLKAKRDEINAHYDAEQAKLQARLDSLTTGSTAWAEYHTAIAEGLTAGTLKVSDAGKVVAAERGGDVPVKPNAPARSGRNWTGSRATLEQWLEYVGPGGHYRRADVQPYEASLALLELSEDETITIDGADYNGLLSRSVGRNGYTWDL